MICDLWINQVENSPNGIKSNYALKHPGVKYHISLTPSCWDEIGSSNEPYLILFMFFSCTMYLSCTFLNLHNSTFQFLFWSRQSRISCKLPVKVSYRLKTRLSNFKFSCLLIDSDMKSYKNVLNRK